MGKTARVDTRVDIEQYHKLLQRASEKGETLSEHTRKIFAKSLEANTEKVADKIPVEITFPFANKKMLELIIWMYSKRHNYTYQGSVKEAEYYFSILSKHYNNLDIEYQSLFSKVYTDLERVIINFNPYLGVNYNFISSYSNDRFDYEKFEELILKRHFT